MTKEIRLQLALDFVSLAEAVEMANRVYPHFDILEVGTPLLLAEGLRAVSELKARFPDRLVLADAKIMDAGHCEADLAFRCGADIVTVLAAADDRTVQGALQAARSHGKRLMADLINVQNTARRGRELNVMGVDIIGLHTAYDRQDEGVNPLGELAELRGCLTAALSIAGGLKLDNLPEIVAHRPDIVVVGGGITSSGDPEGVAKKIMSLIRGEP